MNTTFAKMYCAISCLLERSVDANDLKGFLRYFCHAQSPRQLCVDPGAYEEATTTKDTLKQLCPQYINPAELFVLEGIVEMFGSDQCKKLLRDFQDKFYWMNPTPPPPTHTHKNVHRTQSSELISINTWMYYIIPVAITFSIHSTID